MWTFWMCCVYNIIGKYSNLFYVALNGIISFNGYNAQKLFSNSWYRLGRCRISEHLSRAGWHKCFSHTSIPHGFRNAAFDNVKSLNLCMQMNGLFVEVEQNVIVISLHIPCIFGLGFTDVDIGSAANEFLLISIEFALFTKSFFDHLCKNLDVPVRLFINHTLLPFIAVIVEFGIKYDI